MQTLVAISLIAVVVLILYINHLFKRRPMLYILLHLEITPGYTEYTATPYVDPEEAKAECVDLARALGMTDRAGPDGLPTLGDSVQYTTDAPGNPHTVVLIASDETQLRRSFRMERERERLESINTKEARL